MHRVNGWYIIIHISGLLQQLALDASRGGVSPQKIRETRAWWRSPKPDPYELRAPQGCSLWFPTATANYQTALSINSAWQDN